jgi:hypothetical protein
MLDYVQRLAASPLVLYIFIVGRRAASPLFVFGRPRAYEPINNGSWNSGPTIPNGASLRDASSQDSLTDLRSHDSTRLWNCWTSLR